MSDKVSAGILYLCATPIGNLEDMTYRAVRMLKEADLIAAEDTRNSIKLLNHFDIHTPMTSYHEFNKIQKAEELVEKLLEGKNIVLITDAGMPGISDPGQELVRMAHEAEVRVSVLPGATACVSALAVSGLNTQRFSFEAFLPKDKKKRRAVLEEMKSDTRTIVMYEAPHHLKSTLKELSDVLGEERRISLCRELTKVHEEIIRMTVGEALDYYETKEPKGEYVLVIQGADRESIEEENRRRFDYISVEEHVACYEEKGCSRKEAMKKAASDRGISKRDIYKALLSEDNMS